MRIPLPFVLVLLLASRSSSATLTPVHVAFLTDCTMYSNWQSLGMIFSFKMSGQPGKVTRVMCCTEQEKKNYPKALLAEVETHIAPSFTVHPRTGDNYAAYNKPEAVIDWLQHVTPEEDYILVLDSDMILRRPFLVEVMKPRPKMAVGARYTYMIGVNNGMALRHVPEIAPRNDTLAGPVGRRGDQVGGFFFVHKDDLKRMSTLWLKYTEDVRADPEAYKDSGDVYAVHAGDKPWISEMYGYAFGASKADLWHRWDTFSMIYPEYEPHGIPKLMHYGLQFQVEEYKFDKHWHYGFDVMKCPPWDMVKGSRGIQTQGVFLSPPNFTSLKSKKVLTQYYRDLLSIETVANLNCGLCDFHLRHCPPSQQLYDVCKGAWDFYVLISAETRKVEKDMGCKDFEDSCKEWATNGECASNQGFMEEHCKKSCNVCMDEVSQSDLRPPSSDLEKNLIALEKKLKPSGDASSLDPAAKKALETKGSTSPPPEVKKTSDVPRPVIAAARSNVTVVMSPKLQPAVLPVSSPPPVTAIPSTKSKKELIVRCYRMTLKLSEVKECVAAAKQGNEYQHASQNVLKPEADIVTHDSEDLSLTAQSSPAIDPAARKKLNQEGEGETVEAPAVVEDAKDSNLLVVPRKPTLSLAMWQALGIWVLIILVFLIVVRRVLKLRRRAKSGLRVD